MAFDFVRLNSQYLNVASAPVTVAPVTMSCWFNSSSITQNQSLIILENAAGNRRYALQILGAVAGDPLQFGAASGGTTGGANSSIGYTANTWNHACGIEINAASRIVYLNGGNTGIDTTAKNVIDLVELKIGAVNSSGSVVNHMSGQIAEVGIWNAELTAGEVASLAKGMTCDKVRPQSLVFYAPLVRDLNDQKGGLTITNNNTATVANHPRVYA
jgi:hypothetical protein